MSTSPTFSSPSPASASSDARATRNGPQAHCTREIPRWNEKIGPCGACGNNFGLIFFSVYLQQLTLIYFHLHELTLICLTLTLLSVKSEWCTLGNAWVAAGRQITELSPNENYPQIIPHSELSSNYLRIAGSQTAGADGRIGSLSWNLHYILFQSIICCCLPWLSLKSREKSIENRKITVHLRSSYWFD